MSNAIITLLKILLHGDMKIEEIGKYLNLDTNSIERNIQTLNEYLKEKGINEIKKNNNIYSLDNKTQKVADFFSKLDILSSNERLDIYCIKFLLKGYINLEKERQQIGVSRTTAIKDFKKVRELLEKNDIFIESRNSKGIFLKDGNSSKITEILCDKLMRLFVEKDFLSKKRKELLEEIDILDEKAFVKLYKDLTEFFKIRKSIFTFCAIYSIAIIQKHNSNLYYETPKKYKTKELDDIVQKIDELNTTIDLSENLKKTIAIIIYKAKHYIFSDNLIEKYFEEFSIKLQDIFQLEENEVEKMKKYLLDYFATGYLDYKYGVLWIRKSSESSRCKKLVEIVEKILKEINVEMIYSDVLRISGAISRFFMEQEYVKGFKILSVSRNLDEEYNERVVGGMKSLYPEIEFYYQSFLEFKFNTEKDIEKYNLIISDTENYSIENLRKVNALSIREIQRCLIEFVLDKRFKKLLIL